MTTSKSVVSDFLRIKQQDNKELPERDKHHHFDTQEFAHWFDWTQFLSQSSVEQHQAVHGKLDPVQTEKNSKVDIHHFTSIQTEEWFCYYQLWHIVEDDQIRPRVCWTEIAFVVHSAQLTDPERNKSEACDWCLKADAGELAVWITQLTYRAITVVTGLTTVYCNTPSLHLQSKTLGRKSKI